ncbi:hypothetical protein M3210_02985 [Oceanobacillus luteolus]|uniref:hypothetical protein n=1 Tax=Oceanobacillus luteolus TaxID=1274358 RepID=UPI00203D65E3|nr:hypothetical protein [Oceanobacillus luteolus]MCM3739228.1 hypothetical protein [Oceanobacillus luteolus]
MEKHLKEIAKELRLIRIELQKMNKQPEPQEMHIDGHKVVEALEPSAGDRVTIK